MSLLDHNLCTQYTKQSSFFFSSAIFFRTLPCALLLIIYLTIFLLGTFALFYRVGITVICFSGPFSVHSREITILFYIFAYHQMFPIPMICNLFNTCSLQNRYRRLFRGKSEAIRRQFRGNAMPIRFSFPVFLFSHIIV